MNESMMSERNVRCPLKDKPLKQLELVPSQGLGALTREMAWFLLSGNLWLSVEDRISMKCDTYHSLHPGRSFRKHLGEPAVCQALC
jgi:hypothetical protein